MKNCGPNLAKYLKKNGMHEGDSAGLMVDDDEDNPFETDLDEDADDKKDFKYKGNKK